MLLASFVGVLGPLDQEGGQSGPVAVAVPVGDHNGLDSDLDPVISLSDFF